MRPLPHVTRRGDCAPPPGTGWAPSAGRRLVLGEQGDPVPHIAGQLSASDDGDNPVIRVIERGGIFPEPRIHRLTIMLEATTIVVTVAIGPCLDLISSDWARCVVHLDHCARPVLVNAHAQFRITMDDHGGQLLNPLMRDVIDHVAVLEHGGSESGGQSGVVAGEPTCTGQRYACCLNSVEAEAGGVRRHGSPAGTACRAAASVGASPGNLSRVGWAVSGRASAECSLSPHNGHPR
jgi:hypothetical protein